jgi:hypothetical protein
MTAYVHPDFAHLVDGADDPRVAALAIPAALAAVVLTWSAEQAAERAAALRAELAALTGFHPIHRQRIRTELAALDALLNLANLDGGTGWEYHAADAGPVEGPAPWEPPAPGWEVGP